MSIRRQMAWGFGAAVLALSGATTAFAHEGHDAPGALPPSPNGGRVKEAEHKEAHAGKEAEDELFFEASFKAGQIHVWGLVLPSKDRSAFQSVPTNQFSKIEAFVENPRKKSKEALTLKPDGNGFVANYRSAASGRFLLKVAAFHQNDRKEATIQLETP